MILRTSSASINGDDNKVKQFLLVAEAVMDVEDAGGPRKILEDPRYQTLPSYIKDILKGLIKIQEKHKKFDKKTIEPRFLGALMSWGVSSLYTAYTAVSNFFSPTTTPDPEMQL